MARITIASLQARIDELEQQILNLAEIPLAAVAEIADLRERLQHVVAERDQAESHAAALQDKLLALNAARSSEDRRNAPRVLTPTNSAYRQACAAARELAMKTGRSVRVGG